MEVDYVCVCGTQVDEGKQDSKTMSEGEEEHSHDSSRAGARCRALFFHTHYNVHFAPLALPSLVTTFVAHFTIEHVGHGNPPLSVQRDR